MAVDNSSPWSPVPALTRGDGPLPEPDAVSRASILLFEVRNSPLHRMAGRELSIRRSRDRSVRLRLNK